MILRLQTFFAGLLALLTAALLALAPVHANPTSGGYQDFEPVALEHQHAIQLASLGNFDYFAKVASECCNATNRGVCSFYADTLVLTDGGLLPISDVNTNMSVWSRNPANGDMAWQSVQAQYSNPYEETVSVTMRDVETGVAP